MAVNNGFGKRRIKDNERGQNPEVTSLPVHKRSGVDGQGPLSIGYRCRDHTGMSPHARSSLTGT